jgi:hypothetical protein
VYANADHEKVLSAQIDELRERVLEVEEENIEARGRLQHANARADDMQTLANTVKQDENDLKNRATQQVTKLRVELENEHATELRRSRLQHEAEKRALIQELEKVSRAVEEAHLTTVDPHAWQRLLVGTSEDGSLKIDTGRKVESTTVYDDLLFRSQNETVDDDIISDRHVLPPTKTKSSVQKKSESRIASSSDSESGGDEDDQDEQPVLAARTSREGINQAIEAISSGTSSMDKKTRSGIAERDSKSSTTLRRRTNTVDKAPASPESSVSSRHSRDGGDEDSALRGTLRDVENETLTRALDIERRKVVEAKLEVCSNCLSVLKYALSFRFQIEELANMLSVQHDLFRSHLDKERSTLTGTGSAASGKLHKICIRRSLICFKQRSHMKRMPCLSHLSSPRFARRIARCGPHWPRWLTSSSLCCSLPPARPPPRQTTTSCAQR